MDIEEKRHHRLEPHVDKEKHEKIIRREHITNEDEKVLTRVN